MNREMIYLANRLTSAHLSELSAADRILFHPATHRGVCITVPGIEQDMVFEYGERRWLILKAWDEAVEQLPVAGSRHSKGTMHPLDAAYYQNRKGKFTDMLLKVEQS